MFSRNMVRNFFKTDEGLFQHLRVRASSSFRVDDLFKPRQIFNLITKWRLDCFICEFGGLDSQEGIFDNAGELKVGALLFLHTYRGLCSSDQFPLLLDLSGLSDKEIGLHHLFRKVQLTLTHQNS